MFRKRPTEMFRPIDPKELERIMSEPNPHIPTLVAFVDGRCGCPKCEARTKDIYRMVGHCWNCKAEPILMLYRVGDKAEPLECPLCGNWKSVHPSRRAAPNEIPAAVAGREGSSD